MSAADENKDRFESTAGRRRIGARRWLLVGAGAICLICWIALGLGIFMQVSRGTLLILLTLAAVTTEGLFWLAAAVLGVTVFQARRRIWNWLLRRPVEDRPFD